MMKTRKSKRLFLLLSTLVMTLMSLASFTFTTFAWFVQNRQALIIYNEVTVKAPEFSIQEYKVYGVTSETIGSTTSSFTFVNELVTSIPRYDPYDIVFNRFRKSVVVYVRYTNNNSNNLTFIANTVNTTFSTGTTGSGSTDDNFTSNVLQMTPSPGTTLPTIWTEATISYTNVNRKSFVSFSPSPVKASHLTLQTINPGTTELWFVLEYNTTAMSYIENARIYNNRGITYYDDITYSVEA